MVWELTFVIMFFSIQWSRSPGKTGSHFNPDSDLFVPSERKDVITSTICWTAMAALLVGLGFVMGPVLFQLGSWTACEKCCFFVGIFIWGGVIGVDIDGLTFSRSSVVVLLDEMELVNFD